MTIFAKGHTHTNGLPKHTKVFMSRESKRENGEELGLWKKGLGLIREFCGLQWKCIYPMVLSWL
jgi:hypothetical protein